MLAAAAVSALALGGYPRELPQKDATEPQSSHSPSVRTVRVGDLSAKLIEEAGAAGQTLALTYDRVLVGTAVPVTRGLVEFLVEQNMSRVLYNIALGEKEVSEGGPLTTLDQVTGRRRFRSACPAADTNAVRRRPQRTRWMLHRPASSGAGTCLRTVQAESGGQRLTEGPG